MAVGSLSMAAGWVEMGTETAYVAYVFGQWCQMPGFGGLGPFRGLER